MRFLGLHVPFTRKSLQSVNANDRGWLRVFESSGGAWQRAVTIDQNTIQANHAIFACETLIASDIAKMRVKLTAVTAGGIWAETTNPAYSPVLRRPNHYQNRIQFFETWVLSKLRTGNTVLLKERDQRGVVVRLYPLDWCRVKPMIADNGDVFYELNVDRLSGIEESVMVPAREIIHDRFNCLFHPLIGVTPLFSAALSGAHGQAIQSQATRFFQNGARPGGLLLAPGAIKQETADRLKKDWDEKYSGENSGKVAVLGDGLKYEALGTNSKDSELVDQLKWTAEQICGVYHVPAFMAGVSTEPNYNNVQNLTLRYYSQCLQTHIEAIELCLDEGLVVGEQLGTEFDLDGLLRMDSESQVKMLKDAVSGGIMPPNEALRRLNLPPQDGGDTIYLQQQMYSLAALAKRDAKDDPFANSAPALPAPNPSATDKMMASAITHAWENRRAA